MMKSIVELAYEAWLEKLECGLSRPLGLSTWAELSDVDKKAWEAAVNRAIAEYTYRYKDVRPLNNNEGYLPKKLKTVVKKPPKSSNENTPYAL